MDLTVGLLLGSRLEPVADQLQAASGATILSVAVDGELPADTLKRVRSVCERGAEILLVIDEARSLHGDLPPRTPYCLISDHLNLTGANPLVGPNQAEWGPRFQDLTDAWDPDLRSTLRDAGQKVGIELDEGIVAGMLGRSNTAAEAAMLRSLGADLVSSGFVSEAITGRHAGRRMAGIAVTSETAFADFEALSAFLTSFVLSLIHGRP